MGGMIYLTEILKKIFIIDVQIRLLDFVIFELISNKICFECLNALLFNKAAILALWRFFAYI